LGTKNAYLNSVLNLRFYLQTIHKTKNTKKNNHKKNKKNTKIKKKEYIPFKTTTKTIKSLPKAKYKLRGKEKWGKEKRSQRKK
jgi:hypothetical protein